MNIDERLALLQRAEQLLNRAAYSLDNQSDVCECCGVVKWRNWTEHQYAEQLMGTATKLGNIRASMQGRVTPPTITSTLPTRQHE